ncbi:hypothetical protein pdam_00010027 [Pocillopora damicornis]|uniref:Uncharacterized protein n=1 Tax=Pocillopora damicornis TaxID=46731 RepID=A0A3M6T4Z4_POCDA|nr:hypothetical protein pdam_00010027 [Pocillopora damicornis]
MTRNDQTLRCLENVSEKDSHGNFIELFSHTTWFLRKFIYGPINKKKKKKVTSEFRCLFDASSSRLEKNSQIMRIPYREPPANIIADAPQSSEEIVKS